jgi:molybdopterin-biosynthesis enzyme MoeA-like protein
VAGFYLEDRFFFTPGFPSMSQSMVIEALDFLYSKSDIQKYRKVMTINASENDLIDTMRKIPENIELSSLPKIIGDKRKVVISFAGYDKDEVEKYFRMFVDYCLEFGKEFIFEDVSNY